MVFYLPHFSNQFSFILFLTSSAHFIFYFTQTSNPVTSHSLSADNIISKKTSPLAMAKPINLAFCANPLFYLPLTGMGCFSPLPSLSLHSVS